MTEGFTGIDVAKAKNDIYNFVDSCWNVEDAYASSMVHLFYTLCERWASPKAVEFSNEYIPKAQSLGGKFITSFYHIESGAVNAAQQLAAANGASFDWDHNMVSPGFQTTSFVDDLPACKESIDGQVGMDRANVEVALDVFRTDSAKFFSSLDALPEGIAFYDPDGNMVGSYNRNIKDMQQEFGELYDNMITAITNAIKTESDNILLAKQQATDTLSG